MWLLRELMAAEKLSEWRFHHVPLFMTRASDVTESLCRRPKWARLFTRTRKREDRSVSVTVALRKATAVLELKRLDGLARGRRMSREQSLHGTMRWLMAAQDGTPDDGVSYGYSLYEGWAVSYPETTGYILQTFLWYHDRFCAALGNGAEVLDRACRMAHWEVDVQMESGATPGNFHNPPLVPVVFNTGQVLLGWAEYLRRFDDDRFASRRFGPQTG